MIFILKSWTKIANYSLASIVACGWIVKEKINPYDRK